MSAGQFTLDGSGIGGPRVSLIQKFKQGETPGDRFASRFDLPEVQRSIGGIASVRGFAHPNLRRFPIETWVTEAELRAIQKLFTISYERARVRTVQAQYPYEFRFEDEREYFTDSSPPERAYVANSLVLDTNGSILTTRHFAIYNVVFETEPVLLESALFVGDCLHKISFVLIEGSILSPLGGGQVSVAGTTTIQIPENSPSSTVVFSIPPTV